MVGSFLVEGASSPTRKYYVFCNSGTLTKSERSPGEAGTCSELVTWDKVNAIGREFSDVLMVEVDKVFSDMGSELISEIEEEGYPTPTYPMPWEE